MKSCVIDSPTDMHLEQEYVPTGMLLDNNYFATEPMPMIHSIWMQPRELSEPSFATEPMPIFCAEQSRADELGKNEFATEPMSMVRPGWTQQRVLEAEWHTSFEQAISERAARVSQQLLRLSTTALDHTYPVTDPLPAAPHAWLVGPLRFWRERKRPIIFACLGICLFLLGFDLMGLLVALR